MELNDLPLCDVYKIRAEFSRRQFWQAVLTLVIHINRSTALQLIILLNIASHLPVYIRAEGNGFADTLYSQ